MDLSLSLAVLLGIAAASLWKLAVADRITRWLRWNFVRISRRAQKHRGIGFVFYHIEYLVGCALCAPMWGSLILWWLAIRCDYYWAQAAVYILAGRFVAYGLLRYLQETTTRDWAPDTKWPPPARTDDGDDD